MSKECLVDKVCTEFDVKPNQCKSDLNFLLEELTKEELVTKIN
jgi:hypothetical protein